MEVCMKYIQRNEKMIMKNKNVISSVEKTMIVHGNGIVPLRLVVRNYHRSQKMEHDPTSRMKIYELYLGRLIQEYNHIWQRFKIFAGMNTLLLIIVSCLLITHNVKNVAAILNNAGIHSTLNLFAAVGIIITLVWIMINWGSYQWITLMNEILEDMEKEIFPDSAPRLFIKIVSNQSRAEIVNFNIGLSIIFITIWSFMGFAIMLI